MTDTEIDRIERARAQFAREFGDSADLVASAPGRVNLLGEHTDYNGGFVLPTALSARTRIAFAARSDRQARVFSAALGSALDYEIGREQTRHEWIDYVQGATKAARTHGLEVSGFDALISSEVPLGAGLASSAALAIALLRALQAAFRWTIDELALVKLAQWGENHVVGAPVGILDPMACHIADQANALFIDISTLEYQRWPLPHEAELVIVDSGVRHDHVTGEYGKRREECETAARALGVLNLRQISDAELPRLRQLDPPLDRRARHVVTENARVLRGVDALRAGDARAFGKLFDASHASMRDDFEVSIPAIDRIVERAQALDGVLGARLTGGGFGGAVVCLVRKGHAERIARELTHDGARALVPARLEHGA